MTQSQYSIPKQLQVKVHYSGYAMLSRTYAAQMAALGKHRNKGKQTVTVQHVNVEGGGQAIVGNVQTGMCGLLRSRKG
jgi:hypothetical protein